MTRLIKIADWDGGVRGNVVFVHGLGGHPYETWQRDDDAKTFWPAWLARDIPGLAVWTLAYDAPPTNWFGTSMALQDRAKNVLECLLGQPELRSRPIVFICHSLGGLVVKQVLRSAEDRRAYSAAEAALRDSVKGVVFIATPHTGSLHATILDKLRLIAWPSASTLDLVKNNAGLRDLNVWYRNWSGAIHHKVFYEKSGTTAGVIVADDSSDPGLLHVDPVAVDADHIGICKPGDDSDLVYARTRDFIVDEIVPPETSGAAFGLLRRPDPPPLPRSRSRNLAPVAIRVAVLLIIGLIAFKGVQALRAPVRSITTTTQAPCSPVIDRTQGNVTVTISGACTLGATPAQLRDMVASVLAEHPIPTELLDRYEMISRAFGVTDTALTTFFRILGENRVATEDLDVKLREIAARHLILVKQAQASTEDDPQIAAIKQQAITAIGAGDYPRAEGLLQSAFDADLATARRAQDAANTRFLTAAKTKADLAELKLTEQQFTAAVDNFQEAADLIPATEPLIRSAYLNRLGGAAREAGDFALAGSALTEALSIRGGKLNAEHPDIAESLNNLALLLQDTNRLREAEPLYRRALAIDEKSYGPEHPAVATDLNNLGELLRVTNRLTEAEPLYKRALAIFEKSYGPDHPTVATGLNNLALLLEDTNRLREAEPLYRRALAIDEKSYGPDHPNVAIRLNNLAELLWHTNRLSEAEPLYRRALAIDEKSYGPDHPHAARDLNNLAVLLRDTNRLSEAEPLYRRALAIDERSYGPDHPTVAIRLNNLALLLYSINRLSEAEPLCRRALAIDEKSYGPDHPTVATDLNNLAVLLRHANRFSQAEPLYKRALAIDEKSYGPDHPDVARDLNNLALLLQDSNQLIEAEPLYRRALAIDEKSYGPDHPDVAIDLDNLANLLHSTNRTSEAEPLYRRALAIFDKSYGPDHPNTKKVREHLQSLQGN